VRSFGVGQLLTLLTDEGAKRVGCDEFMLFGLFGLDSPQSILLVRDSLLVEVLS
jgi:hypothetical protein